jgi:hypothetical protein
MFNLFKKIQTPNPQYRGQLVRKQGATRSVIRERIQQCNNCKGRNANCEVCGGSGEVICENIVNIFPR